MSRLQTSASEKRHYFLDTPRAWRILQIHRLRYTGFMYRHMLNEMWIVFPQMIWLFFSSFFLFE